MKPVRFIKKKVRNKMIELNLVLKSKWFDMIESGGKTEEYREVKPYWIRRLCYAFETDERCRTCVGNHCLECLFRNGRKYETKHYDVITFHRGYTKNIMTFKLSSIEIGLGNLAWGAPNKEAFILKLGKRINKPDRAIAET